MAAATDGHQNEQARERGDPSGLTIGQGKSYAWRMHALLSVTIALLLAAAPCDGAVVSASPPTCQPFGMGSAVTGQGSSKGEAYADALSKIPRNAKAGRASFGSGWSGKERVYYCTLQWMID